MAAGRYGANTINDSYPIKIKDIVRAGIITDAGKPFILYWNDGSSIIATGYNRGGNIFVTLSYYSDGRQYNCSVKIVTRPSNLGRGELYYFLCPDTGKHCRIIYRAYDRGAWVSRYAYDTPVYYPYQISSKLWRAYAQYTALEAQGAKLQGLRAANTYNGKTTKRKQRELSLNSKMGLYQRTQLIELTGTTLKQICA